MRDLADNVVVICSIENVDPMGVHTGDSITVAPAQTLSDRQYQTLRSASLRIIREIGVSTGGSNIQFAVDPESDEYYVIEMNPRVSRSSALASKATGFPIAKIAAKLAVGYSLDEIPNDITRATPASFEPALDYVVTKIPRFAFEKFPGADAEADDQDALRGRGHGDREDVHGEPDEGYGFAGGGCPGRAGRPRRAEPVPRLRHLRRPARRDGHTRRSSRRTSHRPFLYRFHSQDRGCGRLRLRAVRASEHLRELKRIGLTDETIATASGTSVEVVTGRQAGPRRLADLQVRRHLRR